VTSPVLGGLIAYAIYFRVRSEVLLHPNPLLAAKEALPWYYGFTAFALAVFLSLSGPTSVRLGVVDSFVVGTLVFVTVWFLARRFGTEAPHLKTQPPLKEDDEDVSMPSPSATNGTLEDPTVKEEGGGRRRNVEEKPALTAPTATPDKESIPPSEEPPVIHLEGTSAAAEEGVVLLQDGATASIDVDPPVSKGEVGCAVEESFVRLMVITSCVLSFSHGSQDVSNSAAPYAAIVTVAASGSLHAASSVPTWVLAGAGAGIVVGLATYGYKVMETVGTGITKLTFSKGFAAQLATAVTALTASVLGMTVSTTHVMIGSIAGVAMVEGGGALNVAMLKKIAASWIITVPASAALACLSFLLLQAVGVPPTFVRDP
jgi:phosphate/sulfate permease